MIKCTRKLIKIGRTDVKSAFGFFWKNGCKIHIAASSKEAEGYRNDYGGDASFHPMDELEMAFRESSALKFISWCDGESIVPAGARQVTFEYDVQRVVLHIR